MIAKNPPPPQMSFEEQQQILKEHFTLFYKILIKGDFLPKASIETIDGIERALSGIPFPHHNAILKYSTGKQSWDECIDKQVLFFKTAQTPFVWVVDEKADVDLQDRLRILGFKSEEIFQGVLGFLTPSLTPPSIPDGWSIELVKDEPAMNEFIHLVSQAFSLNERVAQMYRKAMWIGANSNSPKMFHWLARHGKKAVSALSTLVMGEQVSFWNSASLPEYRRQGFSTALRRHSLHDAVSKGCRIGMSYLPPNGDALGICRQLGYEPRWRFRAYISP